MTAPDALRHAARAVAIAGALGLAACCPKEPAVAGATVSPDGSLPGLGWLSGGWVTEDGSTEEYWTVPRGGSMLGVSRLVAGGQTREYEHLRIAQEGAQVVYHASPVGQPPAAFTLVERTDRRLVFADPKHDFPQRIVYEQAANDRVVARIEGLKDGKPHSVTWSMRRAKGW